MSGGISAIRGFDYQATVVLDLLLDHFARYGSRALVRPEGQDDLDLGHWDDHGFKQTHVQVKKPRENLAGERVPSPWTFNDAVEALISKTIRNLEGNAYAQKWVLGDEVTPELRSLVGLDPAQFVRHPTYPRLVHVLASKETLELRGLRADVRRAIGRWRPISGLHTGTVEELKEALKAFSVHSKLHGVTQVALDGYEEAVQHLALVLPGVMARTTIVSLNGQEKEVSARVREELAARYGLRPDVVDLTLFRNLRGFVSDISKQPGRKFDLGEFDYEIRSVWPTMLVVKAPPILERDHVYRRDIAEALVDPRHRAIEVVGVSGSGKSSLAAEAIALIESRGSAHGAFYAEVRTSTAFRDVLVGIAFRLRRMGFEELLGVVTHGQDLDTNAAARFVHRVSSFRHPVTLFLDLVHGTCSAPFARDLGEFVRLLSEVPALFRLVILGQERAFRALSSFECDTLMLGHIDVRGFHFEEFLELVQRKRGEHDRSVAYELFVHVTTGRSAGLIARLALSLASIDLMKIKSSMAALDPDRMLQAADRDRFMRMSPQAQRAAARLLCFALPFRPVDAASIFPNDAIGLAVREMLDLGLLRSHDEDAMEMHETVRAGLERLLPIAEVASAHAELAEWYGAQDDLPAKIFHLGKAGLEDQAKQLARETFLSGQYWGALVGYVLKHELVTTAEAGELLMGAAPSQPVHYLQDLFRRRIDVATGDTLFAHLTSDLDLDGTDYSWMSTMILVMLRCNPGKICALLDFALVQRRNKGPGSAVLGCVQLGIRRAGLSLDPGVMDFFRACSDEDKILVLPFLLQDGRRASLKAAFDCIASQDGLQESRKRDVWAISHSLQLQSRHAVADFLSALPAPEVSDMLLRKSVLLEPFTGLVWGHKEALRRYSLEILEVPDLVEPATLYNAARVLVCIAEPSVLVICDPVKVCDARTRNLFSFLPSLVPWLASIDTCRSRLLDPAVGFSDRVVQLGILASAGENLHVLLQELRTRDPENAGAWELQVLLQCAQFPFLEALPLLKAHLDAEPASLLAVPLICAISGVRSERVVDFCLGLLDHPKPNVRCIAAHALARQRNPRAMSTLRARLLVEGDRVVGALMTMAIASCHPETADPLLVASKRFPDAKIWYFIVAAQLRDESAAANVVATGCDVSEDWQVRRAAIAAAGRLRFASALEKLLPQVLDERVVFDMDRSASLIGHRLLTRYLERGVCSLFQPFIERRLEFINFVAMAFEAECSETWFSEGAPSGEVAGNWLFERLLHHGFPQNQTAPAQVIGELCVPLMHAAALRSMRLCARSDLIVDRLSTTTSVWFAARCLKELMHARIDDVATRQRVVETAERSPVGSTPFLSRIVAEYFPSPVAVDHRESIEMVGQEPPGSQKAVLTTQAMLDALAGQGVSVVRSLPIVARVEGPMELAWLAAELDPSRDYSFTVSVPAATLRFTESGHSLDSRRSSLVSAHAELRAALRPAVAAANRWNVSIPWHDRSMATDSHGSYARSFLYSLMEQEDGDRFFQAMDEHEHVLMEQICASRETATKARMYGDERMVRAMTRYLAAGTDAFLEGLCTLAVGIDLAAIDPVLDSLLTRWTCRFDIGDRWKPQHAHNDPLWRALSRLAEHSRFSSVPRWDMRLHQLMQLEIPEFYRSNMMRVLERSPAMYSFVESTCFRSMNFEHYRMDEVDVLDEQAERLFGTGSEPG